jgi:hypothetical protein
VIGSDYIGLAGYYKKDATRFALALQSLAVFNSIIRIAKKAILNL